jgi:hypothetical protein
MKTLIFIMLLGSPTSLILFSTPDSSVWENEILIGANDDNFYTIKMCKYLTGTYYYNIDSVFLIERVLNSGKVNEKIVLRVVNNMDVTTEGNWQHTEMIEAPINIIEYQKEKKVNLVYQRNFDGLSFMFSPDGLIINYRESEEMIVSKAYIDSFIDWYDQSIALQETYSSDNEFRIKVSQSYESKTHVFLVVETGADQSDTNLRQSVLAFPQARIDSARQKINRLKK